jgi:predicted alpha/beta hydrolase
VRLERLEVQRGGDRLSVWVERHPTAQTVVVIVPAMGVPGGYYRRFASILVEAGMTVAIADLRGTGESTPAPSRASRYDYDDLADDVGAVLSALAPMTRDKRVVLLGHSLGGQACLIHLARTEQGIDGLILIAVGLPYWRSYGRRRLGVYAFTQGINAVTQVLRVWPGWGFGGRQARGVIADWAYTGRHGRFPARLGVEEKLGGISLPVLAISVDHDQYIPRGTMDFLVSKLESAKVRREHLTRADVGADIDHFKWARAGGPIAELIRDWL